MAHIVIICTANICRSPLVEALLRRKLNALGHTSWIVSSAGTWATQSRPAARGSQRIAQREGLDLSNHIARMVNDEIMAEADLVLVMTKGHKEPLQIEFREARERVFLLSEMIDKSYDVVDPYGGPDEGYEDMFIEVRMLIEKGIDKIIQIADENAIARLAEYTK